MSHKFESKSMHKLDSQERRKILPPHETLKVVGLKQGDVMADVGCGIGYFTIPAAQIVGPTGQVYAIDIVPEMLAVVEQKKTEMANENITTILAVKDYLIIPSGSVTFVFVCNVLHEIENIFSIASELKRILSDNRQIAVIEWNKIQSNFGPPLSHRLAREEVEDLLCNIGFNNITTKNLGEHFYAVLGQK